MRIVKPRDGEPLLMTPTYTSSPLSRLQTTHPRNAEIIPIAIPVEHTGFPGKQRATNR